MFSGLLPLFSMVMGVFGFDGGMASTVMKEGEVLRLILLSA